PADRFRLFPRLSFRGFFVVAAELHLAENALALHLLFQRLEGLVDVIVANENLHASSFSVRSVSALGKWDRGGAGSSAHATSGRSLPEWPMKVHRVAKARSSIIKKARHVPHLPAGAHGDLAVKVNGGARNGEPFSIVIDLMADQIGHFDPAFTYRFGERPAGHSPNVLLELRNGGAVERPMPGIVDPRCDLVHQQGAIPQHEHFHGQHADIVEMMRDCFGDAPRLSRRYVRDRGRHARDLQNVIAMLILSDLEAFDGAVGGAGGDHRYFADERHKGFKDGGLCADVLPGGFRHGVRGYRRLALAVVAEAPRLEHGGTADAVERGGQFERRADGRIGRRADGEAGDEVFFGDAVLGRRQNFRVGQDWHQWRQECSGFRRDVFKLVGDDVHMLRKAGQRFFVVKIGARTLADDVECRRVAIGRKDVTFEAEPRGSEREHPPELTAAKDADRGSGLENRRCNAHAPESLCGFCFGCASGLLSGSLGFSAIAAVCFCRQVSKRLPSAGSLSARTLAAKSAALTAPALPIASVPTGMPGGICTME